MIRTVQNLQVLLYNDNGTEFQFSNTELIPRISGLIHQLKSRI